MSQFVTEKSVFVSQNLESREALLRFVSDKAAEFGITDNADAVYDAFMAREAMGETGMPCRTPSPTTSRTPRSSS